MKLYLIRHGETKGNREHRYVGTTDEGLLLEGRKELEEKVRRQKGSFFPADTVYVSPLKRCRETAEILYPGSDHIVIPDFRECDFGEFEYKNHEELCGSAAYQKFIDSRGESGFPGGETLQSFQDRCAGAFEQEVLKLLKRGKQRTAAFVIHGGTIMAILDRYSMPGRNYYEWQVGNGKGFEAAVTVKEDGFYLGDIREI